MMSPKGPMSSVAVCALKDNPLYNTYVVLRRVLKEVDFDELEKRVMDYYYEHILHMEDPHMMGPAILMASNISCQSLEMASPHLCVLGLWSETRWYI